MVIVAGIGLGDESGDRLGTRRRAWAHGHGHSHALVGRLIRTEEPRGISTSARRGCICSATQPVRPPSSWGRSLCASPGGSRSIRFFLILIGVGIVWSASKSSGYALNILLEGYKDSLALGCRAGTGRCGVIDVHDLHIWSLGSEAHAELPRF